MTDLEMWSLVVGFFLPMVIAVVQQPRFPQPVRALITFLACMVASGVTIWLQGEVEFERWVESGLLILVSTIATYKGLWKPVGLAPEIERATSPSSNS